MTLSLNEKFIGGFVSAEGLNHRGDNLHFDTPSQYELGRRYFEEFCKMSNLA